MTGPPCSAATEDPQSQGSPKPLPFKPNMQQHYDAQLPAARVKPKVELFSIGFVCGPFARQICQIWPADRPGFDRAHAPTQERMPSPNGMKAFFCTSLASSGDPSTHLSGTYSSGLPQIFSSLWIPQSDTCKCGTHASQPSHERCRKVPPKQGETASARDSLSSIWSFSDHERLLCTWKLGRLAPQDREMHG